MDLYKQEDFVVPHDEYGSVPISVDKGWCTIQNLTSKVWVTKLAASKDPEKRVLPHDYLMVKSEGRVLEIREEA